MLEGRQVRQFPVPLTPQRQPQRLEDTPPIVQYCSHLPGAHKEDARRRREGCRGAEAETPALRSHLTWAGAAQGWELVFLPLQSHWGLPTTWH